MATKELLDWIKTEKSKGYSETQIKSTLKQQGYNQFEIDDALGQSKSYSGGSYGVSASSSGSGSTTTLLMLAGLVVVIMVSTFFFISSNSQLGEIKEDVLDLEDATQELEEAREEIQTLRSTVDDVKTDIQSVESIRTTVTTLDQDVKDVVKVIRNVSTASSIACTGCVSSKEVDGLTSEDIFLTLADAVSDGGCVDCISWSDITNTGSLDSSLEVDLNGYDVEFDNATFFVDGVSKRIGVGTANPKDFLEVSGGVIIGYTDKNNTGTIRWTGTDFQGYTLNGWKSLTTSAQANNSNSGGINDAYDDLNVKGYLDGEGPGDLLTRAKANELYGGSNQNFLTQSQADSLYAAKSELTSYATAAQLQSYLTQASAQSTYLTQTNAQSTYLTQAYAQSTYLTQANAQSTYLTQSGAQSTYVKKTDPVTATDVQCTGCIQNSDIASSVRVQSKIDCASIHQTEVFVSVEILGRQIGCMQKKDATGTQTYEAASEFCWLQYGARIPTNQEWYVAMKHFDFDGETDNYEWNADAYTTNQHTIAAGTAALGIIYHTVSADTTARNFRCFVPN